MRLNIADFKGFKASLLSAIADFKRRINALFKSSFLSAIADIAAFIPYSG